MRATFLSLSLILGLLCPFLIYGQAPPDAPSTVLASETVAVPPPFLNPAPAIQPQTPKSSPTIATEQTGVIDKKFMLLATFVMATTTADMELTQHCQNAGTCVEMNPTIPRDRWAKHLVNVPTNAAVMYWAYRWKKQGKRLWWVPPLVDIGIHAVGIGSNVRFAW